MRCPIFYQEGNLVWNSQRQCWAWYELAPFSYTHLNHDEKFKALVQLSQLFYTRDYPGHLLMVPVPYDVAARHKRLRDSAPKRYAEIASWHTDGMTDHVQRLLDDSGCQYRFFVGFQLPRPADLPDRDPSAAMQDWLARTKRFILELAGLEDPVLWEYELRAYRTEETNLFAQLSAVHNLRRADQRTMEWLIRRCFWRGIGEPPLHDGWSPGAVYESVGDDAAIRVVPQKADILGMCEGVVDLTEPRRIAISQDGPDGDLTGYHCHLFVTELPDQFRFPGQSEWMLTLQREDFPVEVSIRWSVTAYDRALAMLRKKVMESDDQERNVREAGARLPSSLRKAMQEQMLLEEDLRARKFPTLNLVIQLCVAAATPQQLRERAQRIKDHFRGSYTASVEIPAGDQWLAFQQSIPGGPQYLHDYLHRLPPEVVAGAMPGASDQLGDEHGVLIGWSATGKPVYLAPWLAPQRQKSASVAFLGTLGGGKSVTANLLTYLSVVYAGAKALVLDPKGERTHWPQFLPELADDIHVVTLGSDPADRGTLDPWGMFKAAGAGKNWRTDAGDLAVNILTGLRNAEIGSDDHAAIMEAVDAASKSEHPSMMRVIAELDASPEPQKQSLATYFRNLANRGLAGLLFGDGTAKTIDVTRAITVLQLQNLQLPKEGADRRDWTTDNYLSIALMQAMTAFATHFTQQDRGIFKIVLLDEAWALLSSGQGRQIVKHLIRTGRAMNNAVYLLAQNAADLDSESDGTILNNIGIKMAFRSKHRDELQRLLRIYNLDDTEANMAHIRDLDSGWCFLQDLDGRCGRVRIDPIFAHLLEAFSTTPPDPTKADSEGGAA